MTTLLTFIKSILIYLLIFLSPLKNALTAVGLLIVFDILTAIYAAYKLKQPITSRKMSESISKVLLYNIALITAYICETYITSSIPFVKVITGIIATTEAKSVFENIGKVSNIFDQIKSMLNRDKTNDNK